jgi:hypothetical protein
MDGKGETVRSLTGSKNVGLNRVIWNLEGEPSTDVRMRTSPEYAPEIKVGPDGTRSAPGTGRISILMPPGTYTVKLLAGGQELTQPLIVKKDPNSGGTEAEITTQTEMMIDLRKDLDSGARMVNQIELIRSQLEQLAATLASTSNSTPVKSAADSLDKKLIGIEETLIQPKLLTKINYLAGGLASGDFGPTKQQREVHALFKQQLAGLRKRLEDVLNQDLPALNRLLPDSGIKTVIKSTP